MIEFRYGNGRIYMSGFGRVTLDPLLILNIKYYLRQMLLLNKFTRITLFKHAWSLSTYESTIGEQFPDNRFKIDSRVKFYATVNTSRKVILTLGSTSFIHTIVLMHSSYLLHYMCAKINFHLFAKLACTRFFIFKKRLGKEILKFRLLWAESVTGFVRAVWGKLYKKGLGQAMWKGSGTSYVKTVWDKLCES